jgi:hypothetical protein
MKHLPACGTSSAHLPLCSPTELLPFPRGPVTARRTLCSLSQSMAASPPLFPVAGAYLLAEFPSPSASASALLPRPTPSHGAQPELLCAFFSIGLPLLFAARPAHSACLAAALLCSPRPLLLPAGLSSILSPGCCIPLRWWPPSTWSTALSTRCHVLYSPGESRPGCTEPFPWSPASLLPRPWLQLCCRARELVSVARPPARPIALLPACPASSSCARAPLLPWRVPRCHGCPVFGPCHPRSAQPPSSALALSLLLRACSSVFPARPAGVFLRAPFSPARIPPATVVLSASACDRGRVHRVRQCSIADSTVVATARLVACSSGVICCTPTLVLAFGSR